MLQEVQVFFISPLSQYNRINDESIQKYKYQQYMGYNKNASIICSLIHYAFNKQILRILESILELINTLKNQSNYIEFTNFIKQTKNVQNPVQKFFQNLYMIDQNNEIAGKILFDFCKRKDWLDGSQILYNNIANYFQMRISFLNINEIYGIKFKDSIDLIVDDTKKFYYLIPEIIIKNLELISCSQCKSKSEFIQLNCEHKQCYKCLLKKPSTDILRCCGKVNQKKYQLNQILKLECLKDQNEKNKILQKYYESANQSITHTDQQLQLNRSVRNQINQDNDKQKFTPTVDTLYKCNLCFKKVYTQLFTLKDCKHQFCYDCMQLQKLQNKDCPLQNCFKKIEQNEEVQTCLIKNNSENKEQPINNQNLKQSFQNSSILKVIEICQKCFKNFNYKLFEIKKCNHKICIQCLSSIDMKYESIQCFYYKCQSTFTKHEYNMYNKNLQSTQNSEALHMQKYIIPQNESHFNCESCYNKRNEDQKYVLNCGHSICFTCITQDVQYKISCCYLTSLDFEYQQFRNNLTINCKGCQCLFPIKDLYQLKCKHSFCLSCCQKIYSGKSQRCLEKKCEKLIFYMDDLFNFIYNQKIEQSKEIANKEEQKKNSNSKEDQEDNQNEQKLEKKDNNQMKEQAKLLETSLHKCSQNQNNNNREEKTSLSVQKSVINLKEYRMDEKKKEEINIQSINQKEIITPYKQISSQNDYLIKQDIQNYQDDSSDFDTNFEEEIIIYQQIEEIKSAQERENEFFKGNCTNCNQEFSPFNRKQLINCQSHQIGVCCVLIKFKNCPICEQILPKKISIKQKLILPSNPVEEEYMFQSTIIKPQSVSYYPAQFQQTYQGYSDQLQKLERQRNNQNSATKRNVTTDTINKRVLENQQALDDKYKYRNELVQHNELALLKASPTPYVQQSYYPNRYDRVNYGGYDNRNRLELHSRDFHLNSKITTGYSGRLA